MQPWFISVLIILISIFIKSVYDRQKSQELKGVNPDDINVFFLAPGLYTPFRFGSSLTPNCINVFSPYSLILFFNIYLI